MRIDKPTITDLTNANHTHANAAGGGQLSLTAAVTGVLPSANGGTGVNNGANTLTIPATGTAALGSGSASRVSFWSDANTLTSDTALQWDNTNKRLGVGGTPSYPLHVVGSPNSRIAYLINTYTASTTAQHLPISTLIELDVTHDEGTNTGSQYQPLSVLTRYKGTANLPNTNSRAVNGILNSIFVTNTGTVNWVSGFYTDIRNQSTGTISDLAVYRVVAPLNSGGGTITRAYGLYVASMTTAATNYAIYTNTGLVRLGDAMTVTAATSGNGAYVLDTMTANDAATAFSPVAVRAELDATFTDGTTGSTFTGVRATARYKGSGSLANSSNRAVQAVFAETIITNTGTTNWASAFFATLQNLSTGTITNAAYFRLGAMDNTGGGTITTAFGLNIGNITAGTTNYSIFTGTGIARFGDLIETSTATGGLLRLTRNDTSVTANDVVGTILFYAADTSTTTNFHVAEIEAQATNTVTTDINPGRLIFRTTPTTVAATPVERMRITEAGNVGINEASPQALLDVTQSSTTAAIPTVILQQDDVSEEFIQFETTVGAGNPIDTAALGTYYGKIRVSVNGTFKFLALYNS